MRKLITLLTIFILSNTSYATDFKLVGTGLLEYSIFKIDVYKISYFKSKDNTEQLVLEYKTDVKKKYSIMGWEQGLKHIITNKPQIKEKVKWITDQVIDLNEGDNYTIRKKNNKVIMIHNDKEIASIQDPVIASLVFEPWIGKNPVDDDLKKQLLNMD